MPKPTPGKYKRSGVEEIASQLTVIAEEIRASARWMSDPDVGTITVNAQNSLDVGLAGLRAWARALSQSVADARFEMVNGSPAVTKAVSGKNSTLKKPKETAP